jgi:hypothetical protein
MHKKPANSDDLPTYFSWRDIDGVDYTTPVKNHLPAFTCETYALIPVLETLVQYEIGYPFGCDLSAVHLFFYSGGVYYWGVDLPKCADYLVKYGVPDEGCFPDPHRKADLKLDSVKGWEKRAVKIKKWGWVENDEEEIKRALIEHGPLVLIIHVWKDFPYYKGGIYKHRWGRYWLGHLVTLVGYDDAKRCWICKNNWGRRWGEDGWFKMLYDPNMIKPYWGGTGILYVDGVYGNLKPDVPRIYISEPRDAHTYVFEKKIPSAYATLRIRKDLYIRPWVIGRVVVKTDVANANKVEFYFDGVLKHTCEKPPFECKIDAPLGRHAVEAIAYNDKYKSKDIIDFYKFL